MNKESFSFELIDKYTPDVVISNSLKQIEEATNGYVVGHIVRSTPIHLPKQTVLGEQDTMWNKFEVFISAKGLMDYKYRMMFMYYGSISYPVTIEANKDLAKDYGHSPYTTFEVDSMKDLQSMMNIMLNSKTMQTIFQNLIFEVMRRENSTSATCDEVQMDVSDFDPD